MNADDLLKFVLATGDRRVAGLKAELESSVPEFLEVSSGDGSPLLRIYSVRAKIAQERGASTEGYEDLLANLSDARNRRVVVLHINLKSKAFLVFTDAETKRIFGVLSGDRKI